MGRVLIPQDITDAGKDFLRNHGHEVIVGSGYDVETIRREVVECDAILARTAEYPAEVLEAGKKLKVIGRFGVGFNNIDIKRAEELGIWVTIAKGANTNSVAEHTMALLLACAKNIVSIDKALRKGDFNIRNACPTDEVEGKTLGLVGMGAIGALVAKKAMWGFGMKVIGYDVYINKEILPEGIEIVDSMDDVFMRSDFVSLHIPAIPSTNKVVNAELLGKMKQTACLINCARGEIVDEKDLYDALSQGKIKFAALDVYDPEPPKIDNPLLSLENIIVSPHNAALTKEAMDKAGIYAAMGICDVLEGKKPSWPVNNPSKQ